MVLDSHTHAWGPASREHPWVNGPLLDAVDSFDVHTVYTDERLLADMDSAGVNEAVVVGYPICEWTDNWYTIEAVERNDRLYGVVMIDQFADDAADQLRRSMTVDGVLGFRLGAACPYDRMWETFDPSSSWLRDAIDETEFWEAAVDTDAVVQILAHHEQLDQALELVETYPELTYLFDHFAHAGPETPPDSDAFAPFAELAEYEGVAVKLSEVQHRSREPFPYEDMHDHARWLLDEFGRERVVWGSDYPNVSDESTYRDALQWLEHVEGVSDTDLAWVRERSFKSHVGI